MPGWISSTTSIASRPTESASLSRAFTCKVTLSAPTSPAPIILQITSPFVGASNPRLGQSGAAHGGASHLTSSYANPVGGFGLYAKTLPPLNPTSRPLFLRDPLERIVAVVDDGVVILARSGEPCCPYLRRVPREQVEGRRRAKIVEGNKHLISDESNLLASPAHGSCRVGHSSRQQAAPGAWQDPSRREAWRTSLSADGWLIKRRVRGTTPSCRPRDPQTRRIRPRRTMARIVAVIRCPNARARSDGVRKHCGRSVLEPGIKAKVRKAAYGVFHVDPDNGGVRSGAAAALVGAFASSCHNT